MKPPLDTAERYVAALVRDIRSGAPKPGIRSCDSSAEHLRVSKLRADHDRVPLAELQRELRLNRLANEGQQSEAARALEVTEGCLRHWLRGRWLPPRWAVDLLRERREKLWPSRRVAG